MPSGIYKRKPMTPEHREKIRQGLLGKKLTIEHRKNLSNSHIGLIPWNKGLSNEITKANAKKAQDALRGQPAWNRGIKMPQISGKNHPAFKGDKVGYAALHDWVYAYKGRPSECEHCGKTKTLQWANKSHQYKRKLNDWLSLCSSCHSKYDGILYKVWEARKVNA